MNARAASASPERFSRRDGFALGFGCVLGLALVKFGNPVILDRAIPTPSTLAEAWAGPWPTRWSVGLLIAFAVVGLIVAWPGKPRWTGTRWLWVLPLAWFGWQLLSATQTVDRALTSTTVLHFTGCLTCYFLGALIVESERGLKWVLVGLLAAFAFCLVRAVNQRIVEFPRDRQVLTEGERTGWTNFPPSELEQMRREGLVIATNGLEIVNPVILTKLTEGRVYGTLVYPNALAGAILLLIPLGMTLLFTATDRLRPLVRWSAMGLSAFLGGAAFYWTGSKSAWLIALALVSVCVFRSGWQVRTRWLTMMAGILIGLVVFVLRFQSYFSAGATSVGARFDYWRAAIQTASSHPLLGTGAGTFQRPYANLKAQESEMARLTHNDYLEQFSDSGFMGGASYLAWIAVVLGRFWSRNHSPLRSAIFLGLLGWYLQGFVEFGLYIPGLAWPAFFLGGMSATWKLNAVDNRQPAK